MTRAQFVRSVASLDARTDNNIKNYFVETDAIRAVQGTLEPGFAIVGLKGSGKTTLYRALIEEWKPRIFQTTVGLSTDTAAFENYFDQINCLQFEKSVRIGMMLFIIRKIEQNIRRFKHDEGLANWVSRKEKVFQVRKRFAQALGRFQGLSILGVGLNWSGRSEGSKFEPISSAETDDLYSLIREFGALGHQLRIVIDDPDRLFTKGTQFDPHLLAGYVLGTNWISAEFTHIQFLHVLKSSVYDLLWEVEEMANLPHDYFHYISWTEAELAQILRARMDFSGVEPSEIFENPETLSMPFFIDRIRSGPRDLLRYIEIILKSSPTAKISETTIRQHEGAFKHEARRQMESVYSGMYEGIEEFTELLFAEEEVLSVTKFKHAFDVMRMESRPPSLDYSQVWLKRSDRALRTLIDAGVVDINVGEQWVRPYEADYFRFSSRDGAALIRRNAVFR